MATEFILMGDEAKFSPELDATYPLVVEILPQALQIVLSKLASAWPEATVKLRMSNQKDGALISENGNLLADIQFLSLPELKQLNTEVKMIPGVVEHSLFYGMATKAIVAGEGGVQVITPSK